MRNLIKNILREHEEPSINEGDIYKVSHNGNLIRLDRLICDGKRGKITMDSGWGKIEINHDGCGFYTSISDDNGVTWSFRDRLVEKEWLKVLLQKKYWVLQQGYTNYFDELNESEDDFSWLDLPELPKGDSYLEKVKYALVNTKYWLEERNNSIYIYCSKGLIINPKRVNFTPEQLLDYLRRVVTVGKGEWYYPLYKDLYDILIQID